MKTIDINIIFNDSKHTNIMKKIKYDKKNNLKVSDLK